MTVTLKYPVVYIEKLPNDFDMTSGVDVSMVSASVLAAKKLPIKCST